MSYAFYNVLHLLGIFLVLLSLGGIATHVLNGGTRQFPARKWLASIHGIGLLLIFVAGFGLMARIGLVGQGLWPTWIFIKLSIWLVLGTMPILIYRVPNRAGVWGFLTFFLAALSAWTAIYKPFLF